MLLVLAAAFRRGNFDLGIGSKLAADRRGKQPDRPVPLDIGEQRVQICAWLPQPSPQQLTDRRPFEPI